MTVVFVLLVLGNVHGRVGIATHEFKDPKVCGAMADNLKQWPQVQAVECFERVKR